MCWIGILRVCTPPSLTMWMACVSTSRMSQTRTHLLCERSSCTFATFWSRCSRASHVSSLTLVWCISGLTVHVAVESRRRLLKRELQRKLFTLLIGWVGRYGQPLQQAQRWPSAVALTSSTNMSAASVAPEEPCSELEFAALQAMSALLCCGPCFNPNYLSEDGIFYAWLDMLLNCSDEKVGNSA